MRNMLFLAGWFENGFFLIKIVLLEDFLRSLIGSYFLFAGNHMKQVKDVPVYKLYGELEHWMTPDMVHCESIAARSQLHNWEIKPHQHHGLFQVLFLKNGMAKIRLDDRHHEIVAGQILGVPQMCIHGFQFSRNAVGHVITIAYPLLDRLTQALGEGMALLTSPHVHTLKADEESIYIQSAFTTLDREYKASAPYRNQVMESTLSMILVWMARSSLHSRSEHPRPIGRGDRHFAAFCQLVEEHFAEHYPVAHYAKQLGITAAHLNALCRQAVNQSALALIHERVLLQAKRNLVYTSMTISVVSYTLGFSDPAYFTRFFKRQTGQSPKDFRLHAKAMFDQGK